MGDHLFIQVFMFFCVSQKLNTCNLRLDSIMAVVVHTHLEECDTLARPAVVFSRDQNWIHDIFNPDELNNVGKPENWQLLKQN